MHASSVQHTPIPPKPSITATNNPPQALYPPPHTHTTHPPTPHTPPPCRSFQTLTVRGTVECEAAQEALDQLAQLVERKCIIAATLKRVPGAEYPSTFPGADLHGPDLHRADLHVAGSMPARQLDALMRPQFMQGAECSRSTKGRALNPTLCLARSPVCAGLELRLELRKGQVEPSPALDLALGNGSC